MFKILHYNNNYRFKGVKLFTVYNINFSSIRDKFS